MICPRCKAAVPEGAMFCGNCGMRLEKMDTGVQTAKTSGQNYASQRVPEPLKQSDPWQVPEPSQQDGPWQGTEVLQQDEPWRETELLQQNDPWQGTELLQQDGPWQGTEVLQQEEPWQGTELLQQDAPRQINEPQQPGGPWQPTGQQSTPGMQQSTPGMQQPMPGMQGVEPQPMSKKEAKKAAKQSADKGAEKKTKKTAEKAAKQSADKASKKSAKQSTEKAAKQSAEPDAPKESKKNAGSAAPKEPKKSAEKAAPKSARKGTEKAPKKGGAKVGIILGILAVVIVAAAAVAVAVVFLLTKKTEVNLNDYLTVSIPEGTNKQGIASYSFDEEQFIQDYADIIELTSDGEAEYGAYIGSYFYPNAATLLVYEILDGGGELNPSSGLSNGDTVTFTWDLDEEIIEQYFNITVKCSDITKTVSGLEEVEELEEVDVFEYITVVFEGMSPEGTARIKVTGGDYSSDDFTLDMDSGLSNGDVVTVTFNAAESMEAGGKTPAATSKTYTAELAKYVSSLDDVTDEFFAECQDEIDSIFEEEISDWDSRVTLVSMTYVTDYLQTIKEEDPNYATYSLYLTYEIVADQNGDEVIYYWYIGFGDVILNADGTYEVDFEKTDIPETSTYLRDGTEFDVVTYNENYDELTQTYKGYISMAELYEDLIAGDDNFTYEGTPYTE